MGIPGVLGTAAHLLSFQHTGLLSAPQLDHLPLFPHIWVVLAVPQPRFPYGSVLHTPNLIFQSSTQSVVLLPPEELPRSSVLCTVSAFQPCKDRSCCSMKSSLLHIQPSSGLEALLAWSFSHTQWSLWGSSAKNPSAQGVFPSVVPDRAEAHSEGSAFLPYPC